MNVARIWAFPEEELPTVIIKAGYGVDNFYETAGARTLDEAVDLAVKMWNTPLEHIFIVTGPEQNARVLGTAKQRTFT
jgi:hypothetical protein